MRQPSFLRRLRQDGRLFWRISLIAVVVSGCAWAQLSYLSPLDASAGLPGGLQIAGLSAYVADISLGNYALTSGTSVSNIPLGSMLTYGTSAELGWLSQGPRTQFVVDYRGAYNRNERFSSLDGFDHSLTFDLRIKATPRLKLSFDGHGESTTVEGSLFSTLPDSSVVQAAPSFELLTTSLASNLGTVGTGASPLAFALFGSRLNSVGLGVSATFQQTPRLSWHWTAHGSRTFPGSTISLAPVGSMAAVGSIPYPAFIYGVGEFGFDYLLSRRTTIGGTLDYSRADSIYSRFQAPSGAFDIEHVLTPNWFLKGEAGYGVLDDFLIKTGSPWFPEYRGGGGVGTKQGSNTFLLSARREIGDVYGLGAGSTLDGGLSWHWQRPAGNWSVDNSGGYERLTGHLVRLFQGWVYQGGVTRKLTKQTSLSLQGVYAKSSGGFTSSSTTFNRSEIRMTMNWTPGAIRP
jgi:hypothetical protein